MDSEWKPSIELFIEAVYRNAKKTKSNLHKGVSDVLKDTMNAYFCYHQTLLDYDFQYVILSIRQNYTFVLLMDVL